MMNTLYIKPSGPLRGSVSIGGSKNAALPILAATLLCRAPVILEGLPDIRDVARALTILSYMGASVTQLDRTVYLIDTHTAVFRPIPDALTSEMRASVYFLGAALARFGEGRIGRIGGCDFGARPIDQHIKAFLALGAEAGAGEDGAYASAKALHAADIRFDTVSVGATVNAILAAVSAKGVTRLSVTAREPHVEDLISFLSCVGADIRRDRTGDIVICGGKPLSGGRFRIASDMIEAGTYLILGAATGGAVRVRGIDPASLRSLTEVLSRMGAEIDVGEREISLFATEPLYSYALATGPYPAFPTDLQPQMGALFSVVRGKSRIRETVWKGRFRYTEELCKMGADITVLENIAEIKGGRLHGASVTATDLRGGAALLIGGACAEGESRIGGAELIMRGYEDVVEKLTALGADVVAAD